MPTYFGYTKVGGTAFAGGDPLWVRNKSFVTDFTCPGAGNQQIKELSAYVKSHLIDRVIRVAIFDASHNLIAQGAASALASTVAGWHGHFTPEDITPNPAILVGGDQYDLAYSIPAWIYNYYDVGDADAYTLENKVDYYTNGFPSPLNDAANWYVKHSIRCGVDPAAAAYTLTAEAGSYGKTGQAAALRASRKLQSLGDSYALTGQSIALRTARKMAAGLGSYSLTGQDAVLRAMRLMAAQGGSYVFTGMDVNLAISHHYTLVCEAGFYGEPYYKIFVTLDGRIYKKMGNTYLRLS